MSYENASYEVQTFFASQMIIYLMIKVLTCCKLLYYYSILIMTLLSLNCLQYWFRQ